MSNDLTSYLTALNGEREHYNRARREDIGIFVRRINEHSRGVARGDYSPAEFDEDYLFLMNNIEHIKTFYEEERYPSAIDDPILQQFALYIREQGGEARSWEYMTLKFPTKPVPDPITLTAEETAAFITEQLGSVNPVLLDNARDLAVWQDMSTALQCKWTDSITFRFHNDLASFATLGWRECDAPRTCFRPGSQYNDAPIILFCAGNYMLMTAHIGDKEVGRALVHVDTDQYILFNVYPGDGHYAATYLKCAMSLALKKISNLPYVMAANTDELLINDRRMTSPGHGVFFNENPVVITANKTARPVVINNR